MYDPNVNQTKFDIYLLGSYGYVIRDALKKLNIALNDRTKEALRKQVKLPKLFYEQGWKRFLIYRDSEKVQKDMYVLLGMLVEGFENGSWSKEELAAYDWQFIFEHCDYAEDIVIGKILIDKMSITLSGGHPFIILNDKYIMISKGRIKKMKINMSFRKIFEYSLKLDSREIKKEGKEKQIILKPIVRYQDKYIDDWKSNDFVEYIYDKVSERFGLTYMSPAELRKRSIVKNGVKALGIMMKINDATVQKEKYKEFVDWLLVKFIFSSTISVGNFVSKATFRSFLIDIGKKRESGTVLGNEGADYTKDVEVSF